MADIKVVRKKPGAWPFIVGLALIVLAIAWLNWDRTPFAEGEVGVITVPAGDTSGEPAGAGGSAPAALPPAVASFLEFAESPQRATMGPEHEYVSTGIERLAAALDAVAKKQDDGEAALQQQLDTFRTKAERLQAEPGSLEHANTVRDVFISAAEAMSAVQQARFPDRERARESVREVRKTAEEMDPKAPLLEQQDRTTTFFDHSADALRLLAGAPADG